MSNMNEQPIVPATQPQPIGQAIPSAVPAPITAPQQAPSDPNAPILITYVGYAKKLLGNIRGRAYGREDTLCLYKDRIEYNCVKNPSENLHIPITSISKVKQRSIEFRIYLQDGTFHMFEMGDPMAPLATSGNLTAMSVAGVASAVVNTTTPDNSDDISAWITTLPTLGIQVDIDPLGTEEGRKKFTIKIVLWTFIVILVLPFIGTTMAVFKGTPDAMIPFSITSFLLILCVVPLFVMRKKK